VGELYVIRNMSPVGAAAGASVTGAAVVADAARGVVLPATNPFASDAVSVCTFPAPGKRFSMTLR